MYDRTVEDSNPSSLSVKNPEYRQVPLCTIVKYQKTCKILTLFEMYRKGVQINKIGNILCTKIIAGNFNFCCNNITMWHIKKCIFSVAKSSFMLCRTTTGYRRGGGLICHHLYSVSRKCFLALCCI